MLSANAVAMLGARPAGSPEVVLQRGAFSTPLTSCISCARPSRDQQLVAHVDSDPWGSGQLLATIAVTMTVPTMLQLESEADES